MFGMTPQGIKNFFHSAYQQATFENIATLGLVGLSGAAYYALEVPQQPALNSSVPAVDPVVVAGTAFFTGCYIGLPWVYALVANMPSLDNLKSLVPDMNQIHNRLPLYIAFSASKMAQGLKFWVTHGYGSSTPEKNNSEKLEAYGFPTTLIPDKYLCVIGCYVMDNPRELPETKQICDAKTIEQSLQTRRQNPFNRQAMEFADTTPVNNLKNEIDLFVKLVVDGIKAKQRCCGFFSKNLSDEDYEQIRDRAVATIEARRVREVPAPVLN